MNFCTFFIMTNILISFYTYNFGDNIFGYFAKQKLFALLVCLHRLIKIVRDVYFENFSSVALCEEISWAHPINVGLIR